MSANEIFGHATYARDEERDPEAEFAIVVEDERQARDLVALLLPVIAEEARRAGVETLTGIVLAKNRRILNLTRRVLSGRICSFRGGTCVICAPLATPWQGRSLVAKEGHELSTQRSHERAPNGKDFPKGVVNDH